MFAMRRLFDCVSRVVLQSQSLHHGSGGGSSGSGSGSGVGGESLQQQQQQQQQDLCRQHALQLIMVSLEARIPSPTSSSLGSPIHYHETHRFPPDATVRQEMVEVLVARKGIPLLCEVLLDLLVTGTTDINTVHIS